MNLFNQPYLVGSVFISFPPILIVSFALPLSPGGSPLLCMSLLLPETQTERVKGWFKDERKGEKTNWQRWTITKMCKRRTVDIKRLCWTKLDVLGGGVLCNFALHVENTVDEMCNFWSREKGYEQIKNDTLQLKIRIKTFDGQAFN